MKNKEEIWNLFLMIIKISGDCLEIENEFD